MTFLETLNTTGVSLIDPLIEMWQGFTNALPGILGAVIILLFGYIVALILSSLVYHILLRININKLIIERTGLKDVAGKLDLPHLFGLIVKWYVIILFLPAAADVVGLSVLSEFLLNLSFWIPNLIVGIIIALVGFMAAEYVSIRIKETKAEFAPVIAKIVKIVIWVFLAVIILQQLGITVSLVESSLLIVLSGIMLAVAIAFGIGFGFALKDEAKSIIKAIKKKL